MQTFWFTSGKGGVGKTLLALSFFMSLMDKYNNKNILLLDCNNVNTDFFDIMSLTNTAPKLTPITCKYQGFGKEATCVCMAYEHKSKLLPNKVVYTRPQVPFFLFPYGYDFVNCVKELVDQSKVLFFDGRIDYVIIETNFHLGFFFHYNNYTSNPVDNPVQNFYVEQTIKEFKCLNSKIMFFWTWGTILSINETDFLFRLDETIKINSQGMEFSSLDIINIMNMSIFIGNVNGAHPIVKPWDKLAQGNMRKKITTTELCDIFLNYLAVKNAHLGKNNFQHLKLLGCIFDEYLESFRPQNLLILPEFYHDIKGYAERILRYESIALDSIRAQISNSGFYEVIYSVGIEKI